jgi:hypothetical protein
VVKSGRTATDLRRWRHAAPTSRANSQLLRHGPNKPTGEPTTSVRFSRVRCAQRKSTGTALIMTRGTDPINRQPRGSVARTRC